MTTATKDYYRALPTRLTTPNEDRYVIDVHEAFDWVENISDATPDYLESVEATQQKLKEQHHVDTDVVKVEDPKMMEPRYVLRRKGTDVLDFGGALRQ